MKAVVDTGIWISALKFGGVPLQAIETVVLGDSVAISVGIEDEIHRILHEKFGWTRERVVSSLAPYLHASRRIATTGEVRGVCRDPKDDMVLECALLAGADVLLSGDKDLLTLGQFEGTRILTARAYLEECAGLSLPL